MFHCIVQLLCNRWFRRRRADHQPGRGQGWHPGWGPPLSTVTTGGPCTSDPWTRKLVPEVGEKLWKQGIRALWKYLINIGDSPYHTQWVTCTRCQPRDKYGDLRYAHHRIVFAIYIYLFNHLLIQQRTLQIFLDISLIMQDLRLTDHLRLQIWNKVSTYLTIF